VSNAQESGAGETCKRFLPPSCNPVTSVFPESRRQTFGHRKRTSIVSLWDTASGKLVREIPGYTWFMPLSRFGGNGIRLQRHIDAIAFSREGNFLVTCQWRRCGSSFGDYNRVEVSSSFRCDRRCPPTGTMGPATGLWGLESAISKGREWLVTGSKSTTSTLGCSPEKTCLDGERVGCRWGGLSADGNTLVAGAQLWNLAKRRNSFKLGVERGLWNDALPFAAKDAPAVVTGSQVNSAMAVSDDGTRLAIYDIGTRGER